VLAFVGAETPTSAAARGAARAVAAVDDPTLGLAPGTAAPAPRVLGEASSPLGESGREASGGGARAGRHLLRRGGTPGYVAGLAGARRRRRRRCARRVSAQSALASSRARKRFVHRVLRVRSRVGPGRRVDFRVRGGMSDARALHGTEGRVRVSKRDGARSEQGRALFDGRGGGSAGGVASAKIQPRVRDGRGGHARVRGYRRRRRKR
jgi:hypothetical protein